MPILHLIPEAREKDKEQAKPRWGERRQETTEFM